MQIVIKANETRTYSLYLQLIRVVHKQVFKVGGFNVGVAIKLIGKSHGVGRENDIETILTMDPNNITKEVCANKIQ